MATVAVGGAPASSTSSPATAAAAAERFAAELAQRTGLDRDVVRAWVASEGAYAPNGTGGFNFLNVRVGPSGRGYSGVPEVASPAGFARFRTVEDAVAETSHWLTSMHNYSAIRAVVAGGGGPMAQLRAIAASPWDANHYAGGSVLLRNYAAARGDSNIFGRLWGGVSSAASSAAAAVASGTSSAVHDAGGIFHDPLGLGAIGDAITGGVDSLINGFLRIVVAGFVLALAVALLYSGVRRLSGDRLPSAGELATVAATKGV